ncbi:uncharacterized protein H6S33_009779 [Morchella sextelata]|uniref:uncharacterized protein n=1 Tax=Morchella sextelata TaxID=1174677 RepID=UPI001D047415|nr:uncharacterized protein H6S33_009779 [Morchella sextelata]KAH0613399.1 hypothetical protein H6S33_009779 [Morchella sextelata]
MQHRSSATKTVRGPSHRAAASTTKTANPHLHSQLSTTTWTKPLHQQNLTTTPVHSSPTSPTSPIRTMESPILIIATENAYFNTTPFEQEGYTTTHIPRATQRDLEDATDNIEPHLKYAIIAFGKAATHALSLATSSIHSIACPSSTSRWTRPSPRQQTPARPHQILPIPSGFAEPSSPTYDAIASSIAYTRTLELSAAPSAPLSIMTTFGSVI